MRKEYVRFTKIQILAVVLLIVAVVAGVSILVVKERYQVTKVTVTGNRHYTEEQIRNIVMEGKYGSNSLYLHYKYRNKDLKDIPFVETMDVEIISPHEIAITVYEKAVAGYVEYLGRYMYFDKDGIVVESSLEQTKSVPYVTGLTFDHVVLHEKLPVENDLIFKDILSITQLFNKFNIAADKIYFSPQMEITLYFGEAKVFIGTMDNIDEKMIRLQHIIPKLQGLKGVLHMENYTDDADNQYTTFQKEEEPQSSTSDNAAE